VARRKLTVAGELLNVFPVLPVTLVALFTCIENFGEVTVYLSIDPELGSGQVCRLGLP